MGAQKEHLDKPNYDPSAEDREIPVHEVSLVPFLLSKYEMTQAQWERFTGENPSHYRRGDIAPRTSQQPGLHPVEQVNWQDCDGVLGRLGLALPTEAQWEYASRGRTSTPWWTGAEPESLQGAANLADAFCQRNGGPPSWSYEGYLDDGFVAHAPVGIGSLRPNGFGLHDVHGNVWEWCRDRAGLYKNPVAPGDGERQLSPRELYVLRGGCYDSPATSVRSAYRHWYTPEGRSVVVGLRPSRVIDP
jgi:formylglycine-generating enzyme required for sulfatase activity